MINIVKREASGEGKTKKLDETMTPEIYRSSCYAVKDNMRRSMIDEITQTSHHLRSHSIEHSKRAARSR
jgi:hypothetical protein